VVHTETPSVVDPQGIAQNVLLALTALKDQSIHYLAPSQPIVLPDPLTTRLVKEATIATLQIASSRHYALKTITALELRRIRSLVEAA
jgi:hypothetical protein